jgi:hypothetical protein
MVAFHRFSASTNSFVTPQVATGLAGRRAIVPVASMK